MKTGSPKAVTSSYLAIAFFSHEIFADGQRKGDIWLSLGIGSLQTHLKRTMESVKFDRPAIVLIGEAVGNFVHLGGWRGGVWTSLSYGRLIPGKGRKTSPSSGFFLPMGVDLAAVTVGINCERDVIPLSPDRSDSGTAFIKLGLEWSGIRPRPPRLSAPLPDSTPILPRKPKTTSAIAVAGIRMVISPKIAVTCSATGRFGKHSRDITAAIDLTSSF
jgi:hypothetical protein